MGDGQGELDILLDEDHRDPLLPVDAAEHLEDVRDDPRREPERRLVDQEEAGPAHEAARDRHHLLLAPGERAGQLIVALAEAREERLHRGEALRAMRLGRRMVRAEEEVLPHREVGEQPAALEHVREAAGHPCVGRQRVDAPAVDLDAARLRGDSPDTLLRTVDFPAPFGPRRATISPAPTARETSQRTWKSP